MKQLGIRIMPILLVLLLMLSACGTQNAKNQTPKADGNAMHEPVAQAVVEFLTFEDALQRCTDIIRARFVGCHNYETYRELEFDVLEIAKGSTTVKTIYILEQFSTVSVLNTDMLYTSGIYEYEIGTEYLLVLERNVSIYQEHDRYVQLSDIYIPLSNLSESLIYGQKLGNHISDSSKLSSADKLISYVKEIAQQSEYSPDYYGTAYCESDDLKTVVEESGFIFHVKVDELIAVGVYTDTETYHCSILDYLCGDLSYLSNQDFDAGIFVVFWKGTVSPGEEYVVLLNKVDANSIIFNLSSNMSCIPMSEESTVRIIENLIHESAVQNG